VLLQTGAAYVRKERIHSLYRVILFGMDNIGDHLIRLVVCRVVIGHISGYR